MDPEPTSFLFIAFQLNYTLIIGLTVLSLLLICSALISGVEVAVFSLSRSDIENGLERSPQRFKIIDRLLQQPNKLLATILVANNFINIAVVLLFAYIGEFLFNDISNRYVRFAIEVGLVTFLILLFGEILPKVYASRNNVKFSSFMAYPLRFLNVLFSPITYPMKSFTNLINKKLGKQKSNISVNQLSQALELTSDGETTIEEHKILQGIVSFGNTDTKQVMQPRIDIFAIEVSTKFKDILPNIVKQGYSRIPVYKDNIDNIEGILYIKDLLPFLDKNEFEWASLIRNPFFVPENKKLDDLMVEFKNKKVHLAVVVDEYGGTSGIISLEDVIEEIVGDISDEFDEDDISYTKIDDLNYVFEGKTTLKDFYKIVKIKEPQVFEDRKGEAETIAGFILEISGSFPKLNNKISFNNYVFTIEALDRKRLKRIKTTLPSS
ncbi:MAG: magnesium/cobalt efflux protein [Bacteroidetes bacterium MedPE-SWsnd-G2]|nr:MAG: magnesium/cobalt efflux protein [Bacteroidetes bacterium MedPE-SWsnd-G2]